MTEPERLTPEVMAMVVARDVRDGDVVTLGIGLPLACANVLPAGREILLHSELGLLGFGPVITDYREADPYLTMVGNLPVRANPGMSVMSHDESFALIRGGHLDVAVLGGLQVDREGNLANTQFAGKPTDIAVMDISGGAVVLSEVAPGWSPDAVQALTGARLRLSPDLREIALS